MKCQDPDIERQIDLDTPRTFPNNPLFRDEVSLFNRSLIYEIVK